MDLPSAISLWLTLLLDRRKNLNLEVAVRKSRIALAIVFLSAAGCALFSCSDDECTPCSVEYPPSPEEQLLGSWTVFEATMNGSPYPNAVGDTFEFLEGDQMVLQGDTNSWHATDGLLFVKGSSFGSMTVIFMFYIDADTLDMTTNMSDMTFNFRLASGLVFPTPE
jgi:hypothetical protein